MKIKWYTGAVIKQTADNESLTIFERNAEGKLEATHVYDLKKPIDLSKDEYRLKNTTAPTQ